MRRIIFKFSLLFLSLCSVASVSAQHSDRDYIRHGNHFYRDSLFQKAEVEYRKALEKNPQSTQAMYNLGNALLMQQKAKEAMKQYEAVSKIEKNKSRAAMIFHNAGFILQSQKQYGDAIEMYKQSLRNNPQDDETRYNLVLCQRLLKKNPQQNKNNKNQNKNQNKDKQQQKQQQQQKKQQDKQKEQQKQQQQPKMSKDNAAQLLNAAMEDEKNTQRKVQKALAPPRSRKLEKDW
jgi:tetratricopeptide (TPR) repeat protein